MFHRPYLHLPRRLRAARLLRAALPPLMLGTLLLLGGCLEDASNTEFNFGNAADPSPGTTNSGSDEDTNISVFYVDSFSKVAVIVNLGFQLEVMDGWSLEDANADDEIDLPLFEFFSYTLNAGKAVRVHGATGTDDGDDLYGGGSGSWPSTGRILLLDGLGNRVGGCEDDQACWEGGPES